MMSTTTLEIWGFKIRRGALDDLMGNHLDNAVINKQNDKSTSHKSTVNKPLARRGAIGSASLARKACGENGKVRML